MPTLAAQTRNSGFTSDRHPLLLFIDGECAFCNRWAYRLKHADHAHRVRFGAKQGHTFQRVAAVYPEIADVESVVVVKRLPDGAETCLVRSRAIREVIAGVPGFGFFDLVLRVCPAFLADAGYRIFAKLRGVLFGRWHHRRRPLEEDRALYVD